MSSKRLNCYLLKVTALRCVYPKPYEDATLNNSTLLRRWKSGKSTAESREDQQHLTIREENVLVEWITHLTACGHPPRHAFIRDLAQEIQSSRTQRNGDSSNPLFSLGTM